MIPKLAYQLILHEDIRTKPYRDTVGKHLNFGIVYGLGIEKLMRKLRCDRKRAEYLMEWYYKRFPGIVTRWETRGQDIYSSNCPGMVALGDIAQLQHELPPPAAAAS